MRCSVVIRFALIAFCALSVHAMELETRDVEGDGASSISTATNNDDLGVNDGAMPNDNSLENSGGALAQGDAQENSPATTDPVKADTSRKVDDGKSLLGLGFNILTGRMQPNHAAQEGKAPAKEGSPLDDKSGSLSEEDGGQQFEGGSGNGNNDLPMFRERKTQLRKQHHARHRKSHSRALKFSSAQTTSRTSTFTSWNEEVRGRMLNYRGKGNAFGADGPFVMEDGFQDLLSQYASQQIVMEQKTIYKVAETSLNHVKASKALKQEVCGKNYPTCDKPNFADCSKKDLRYFSSFLSQFGSHYVNGVTMGGSKTVRYNFNSRDELFQNNLAEVGNSLSTYLQRAVSEISMRRAQVASLSRGLAFPGMSASTSAPGAGSGATRTAQSSVASAYTQSVAKMLETRNKFGVVGIRTSTKGGAEYPFETATQETGSDAWVASIAHNPAPVHLEIYPLTGLIAAMDCEGAAAKAELFNKAVKTVLKVRYEIAENAYAAAESKDAEEQLRQLVTKVKSDWFDRMRKFVSESIRESTGFGIQEAAAVPTPKTKEENDEATSTASSSVPSEDGEEVPKGLSIDPMQLRQWVHQSPQHKVMVSAPVFAVQKLNHMTRQCAAFCSSQRKLTKLALALGSSPAGAGGGNVKPAAESSGGDTDKESSAPEEGGNKAPPKADGMFSLSELHFANIENQEQQCQLGCGSVYRDTMNDFTELYPGVDSVLNDFFVGMTKRTCQVCNRAVALDALQASPGLAGNLITRPVVEPAPGVVQASYCDETFQLSNLDKDLCHAVTSTLAIDIQKSTRYDGDEFFVKESLSSMLLGLSSCVSNCAPDTYSFANLQEGAAPGTWAAQVCGYYMNCPSMEVDELAVAEQLRSLEDQGDASVNAATEIRESMLPPMSLNALAKNPSNVKGGSEIQAQRDAFCGDILAQQMSALALRQRKLSQMVDQTCFICLSEMGKAMSPQNVGGKAGEGKDDTCAAFQSGKDDQVPASFDVTFLVDAKLQALMTGYSPQDQMAYAAATQELASSKKITRRRRLLRVVQERRSLAGAQRRLLMIDGVVKFVKSMKRAKAVLLGKTQPAPQAKPKTLKDCSQVPAASMMHMPCKYASIWSNPNVQCRGIKVHPEKTFEALKAFKEKMDTPFRGSKKWCEGNKKYVLDGAAKLSQVLSGIVDVSDAAGINNDITKFSHLHARVFLTMTAIRAGRVIQTAALRNAFKKASTGRELSRYGAPLAAGPAAMCIELNMCSPVRANAILDAVRMGTAPYAPEVKKAAAKK